MLCLSFKWIQIPQMCVKASRLRLICSALMLQSKLCWDFSLEAKITFTSAECQPLRGEAVNRDRKQTVVSKGHSREWAPHAVLIIGGLYTGLIPGGPQRGQQPGLAHLITLLLLGPVVVEGQQDKLALISTKPVIEGCASKPQRGRVGII